MLIALDATTNGGSTGATTMIYPHTCSGGNRILLVAVANFQNAGSSDTVTAVYYNGKPLTLISPRVQIPGYGGYWESLWYLINPPVGTYNVEIDLSSNVLIVYSASASYTGVDQTNPIDFSNYNLGSDTQQTTGLTVSSASNWIFTMSAITDGIISGGTNVTLRQEPASNFIIGDSNGPVPQGFNQAQTTFNGEYSGNIIAVVLKAAVATYNKLFIENTHSDDLTPLGAGAYLPTSVTQQQEGGQMQWQNINNIKLDNSQYTIALLDSSNITSYFLEVSNFAASLPGNATINGILVEIKGNAMFSTNLTAYLINSDLTHSANKTTVNGALGTTDTIASFGGIGDTWGMSLTPSNIMNVAFGVGVQASNLSGQDGNTVSLDVIKVTIFYTTSSAQLFGRFKKAITKRPQDTYLISDQRTNLLANPSFEQAISSADWRTGVNGGDGQFFVPNNEQFLFNSNSAKVTFSTQNAFLIQTVANLIPGKTYTFSAYVYIAQKGWTNGGPTALIDSTAPTTRLATGNVVTTIGSWQRTSVSYTIPITGVPFGTPTSIQVVLDLTSVTSYGSPTIIYWDGAMLEEGPTLNTWAFSFFPRIMKATTRFFSDLPTVSEIYTTIKGKGWFDSITSSEFNFRSRFTGKTFIDITLPTSDTLTKQPTRIVSDAISNTENFNTLKAYFNNYNDVFVSSEVFKRATTKLISDIAMTSDTMKRATTKALSDVGTTITDIFGRIQRMLNKNETITTSEVFNRITTRLFSDILSTVDIFSEFFFGYTDYYTKKNTTHADKYTDQPASYIDDYTKKSTNYTTKY